MLDAVHVGQHVWVPEPQYPPPTFHHPAIAKSIVLAVRMLAAIHLDHQPGLDTAKVRDVRAEGMLTAKLCITQTPAT